MEKSLSFNQMELKAQSDHRTIICKHFDTQTNKHKSVKHDMKFQTKTYFHCIYTIVTFVPES